MRRAGRHVREARLVPAGSGEEAAAGARRGVPRGRAPALRAAAPRAASAALAGGHLARGGRGARPVQRPRALSPQGVARLRLHVRLLQPLPARSH